MNDFTGVLGVFNCQGASWCRVNTKNLIHNEQPGTVSCSIQAKDVHYLTNIAEHGWNGDTIVYSHRSGNVLYLPKNKSVPVQLQAREYEVFTVVPIKRLSNEAAFAPIGLLKMFNSGGAVTELNYESQKTRTIDIRVRGCGVFGAYSSVRPERILIDMKEEEFDYEEESGLISLNLRIPEKELYQWNLTLEL